MNDPLEIESTAVVTDRSGMGRIARLRTALRDSVVGTRHDFTEGSIGRAIMLLAIPMVLEMSMESLFGIVNVFWVSHLGTDSIAAVGLTESLLTLVFAVAMGLSMATTAMVARRIGEKDPAGAAVAAVQSIIIGFVFSLPIAIAAITYMPVLLRLMNASPSIIEVGTGYGTIILGGNMVIMLLFLNNAIFRGAGDASIAMRSLWVANAVNLVLDPCFIFGVGPFPKLGVTGSAVATTIGRGLGVCFQLYVLMRGGGRVQIERRQVRLDPQVMLRLLRVSIGGMLQFLVATASWLGLVRIVAIFGGAALAGYTIALRIIIFAILPSWGMSNAAATLVGQNLGAGKPERAERSVWVTGFCNMVFLGLVTIVFVVFARPLINIFTTDPDVVPYGIDALRYISYGYVFYAYGMVMVASFNGAGDTTTPTLINLGCYWLFQIPLAYTLALPLGMGARGVFLAICIAESTIAVVGMLIFRRGKWKTRKI
ncbi:MAG TPA: MATE family efflux transporter [Blastocatellia bacterium]|jgi:putative MATE family efflux protein|nr:MATE family efflux transporter [Blastocatellia bacterium]